MKMKTIGNDRPKRCTSQHKGYGHLRLLFLLSIAVSLVRGGTFGALDVTAGVATFVAPTNISAVTVHGKSNALVATAMIDYQDKSLVVEQVQAKLSIHSLSTGMGLRDSHMRKFVFTASDGATPDLTFQAGRTECSPAGADFVCQVPGELSIRGLGRPFTAAFKVRGDGSGRFRSIGEGTVRLSDYGIQPPSQLGVRVAERVQVRFEFTACVKNAVVADARIGK
jgi:polyisoprenoid-binding protein YceI